MPGRGVSTSQELSNRAACRKRGAGSVCAVLGMIAGMTYRPTAGGRLPVGRSLATTTSSSL
jgi:hypothetical protein